MAPLTTRRSLSSSLPTVVSLSKLFQIIPAYLNDQSSHSRAQKRHLDVSTAIIETAFTLSKGKSPIEPEDPPGSPQFVWKLIFSAGLVLLGGVFAGLTLALMGSDDLNLRVLATSSSDAKEKKAAQKVLRLLSRGRHWVLVVLLLGNVIVNESLPIFLDDVLGGGVAAVIVSTTMIVIFGEIIPQAVCVRFGLAIGGVCAPFVLMLMIVFSPIAWPVAKLLDYVLGSEAGHTYKKAELKSFLQFHREGEEPLRDDEIGILNGVLSLNDKHAQEIMTPIKDCLTLPADEVLDHAAIDRILFSGFSRIPVHEPGQKHNFIGMLLVKRLITYNPDDEWPVSKFSLLPLPEARPDINCFQALDYFQTGRAHLLLLSETPGKVGGALGIVSLEDLIEEIIGEEIIDETDRYTDNHNKRVAKRSGTAAVMRGIIERQRVITAMSRRPSHTGGPSPANGHTTLPPATEGLLIQINETGALSAEPVAIPELEAHREQSKLNQVTGPEDLEEDLADVPEQAESSSGENGEGDKAKPDLMDLDFEPIPELSDVVGNCASPHQNRTEYPYETYEEFESTCQAFLRQHNALDGQTDIGWEWRDHPISSSQGYLFRRVTRAVPKALPDEPEDGAEENGLEEEEDSALLRISTDGAERTVSRSFGIEISIVYARTYRVPMLCLSAWDEAGAPISLSTLIEIAIIRPPASTTQRLDVLLLPDLQFPLVQQTEHPSTRQVVWSIHPCHVSEAVAEFLESEGKGGDRQRWFEIWLMLSNGIVDLSYP